GTPPFSFPRSSKFSPDSATDTSNCRGVEFLINEARGKMAGEFLAVLIADLDTRKPKPVRLARNGARPGRAGRRKSRLPHDRHRRFIVLAVGIGEIRDRPPQPILELGFRAANLVLENRRCLGR